MRNFLKNYKYCSSFVILLIMNKKIYKFKWWFFWRDMVKFWWGFLKFVWLREGDCSYEGGVMWSVFLWYEVLSCE